MYSLEEICNVLNVKIVRFKPELSSKACQVIATESKNKNIKNYLYSQAYICHTFILSQVKDEITTRAQMFFMLM